MQPFGCRYHYICMHSQHDLAIEVTHRQIRQKERGSQLHVAA